ncbi:uncharacterized protein LOC133660610 isoform X1 [Entelurus aequoreus]|uniref:uncharacterized protein LOC133660610 isoform X1 n=1 Tax=Entelurus aequoreus TaxID=161455 RepID=UPI002B1E8BFE|nr:uncharacterized protein LOC133660610 isoform X1 [Entelurus aequoreus]
MVCLKLSSLTRALNSRKRVMEVLPNNMVRLETLDGKPKHMMTPYASLKPLCSRTHPGWPKDSPSAPVLPGDAEMLTSSSEEETECHCFTDHTYAGPTSPWKKELHPDQKQLEIPRQTSGNDCGVFMLMYSLWLCTDTTFHYSVLDMQSIRRWWCVLLMERFGIEGHGQRFCYWTDKASGLLQGILQPVFRVSRNSVQAIDCVIKD